MYQKFWHIVPLWCNCEYKGSEFSLPKQYALSITPRGDRRWWMILFFILCSFLSCVGIISESNIKLALIYEGCLFMHAIMRLLEQDNASYRQVICYGNNSLLWMLAGAGVAHLSALALNSDWWLILYLCFRFDINGKHWQD